jgi:hypothetical protein
MARRQPAHVGDDGDDDALSRVDVEHGTIIAGETRRQFVKPDHVAASVARVARRGPRGVRRTRWGRPPARTRSSRRPD